MLCPLRRAMRCDTFAVAGLGMYVVIKRYIDANPQQPVSDAAREAGRKWEREIAEQERKKEAGEENE